MVSGTYRGSSRTLLGDRRLKVGAPVHSTHPRRTTFCLPSSHHHLHLRLRLRPRSLAGSRGCLPRHLSGWPRLLHLRRQVDGHFGTATPTRGTHRLPRPPARIAILQVIIASLALTAWPKRICYWKSLSYFSSSFCPSSSLFSFCPSSFSYYLTNLS